MKIKIKMTGLAWIDRHSVEEVTVTEIITKNHGRISIIEGWEIELAEKITAESPMIRPKDLFGQEIKSIEFK